MLPEKKRKGRPPKKFVRNVRTSSELGTETATTNSNNNFNFSYLGNREAPSIWQTTFTGSFDPVTGDDEGAATRIPVLAERQSHGPLPRHDEHLASQDLARFPLRNTSDAIRLLDQDRTPIHLEQSGTAEGHGDISSRQEFFLLREGFIDEATLFRLFNFYLNSLHPIMPLIPYERMPTTSEHILNMAGREPHFTAAILVVTSGLLGEHNLHQLLWRRVERVFAEVAIKGTNESLEMIEGLLLLSGTVIPLFNPFTYSKCVDVFLEYPPNMGHSTGLRFEDRMCWMTVGTVS